MILYRPVGLYEFRLIRESGFKKFLTRLSHQPFFYPVLTRDYAEQIARDWNTRDQASGHAGYVVRFEIDDAYASQFPIRTAGKSGTHEELWVPAADLEEFNSHILGAIEVCCQFFGREYSED